MEQPAAHPESPRRLSRRGRWIGGVLALVGLALLGWLAWHLTHSTPAATANGFGGPGRRAPASTVGVATATAADIPVLLDALGTVTPLAQVTVQPQVSGVLTQIAYKEGQMVRKGELLAVIEPQPFQLALAQAKGARLRDEAQLDAARVTLQRYRTLLEQDSIARQDVDTQAALVHQLEGTVAIDRAAEGTAALNLGYTRIVAPVSGRVGLRPVDAGNYIAAGTATGVAVITQLNPIDVGFALPQDRVPEVQARVAAGAKLPASAWDQTRTRRLDDGVFLTLDNSVDTQTGTVKAKARFPNAAGVLFPNQFVNVRLLLSTVHGAVVVPVTALRHGPDGDFVYVVTDDRTVSLRPVTRGAASVDRVVIASGLSTGEQVVTEGGDRLKDGAPVQLGAARAAVAASAASGAGHTASRPGRRALAASAAR